MSGHSKFKTIMHRKGAQDAKRSRIFARLVREITVAAKLGGSDPEHNPRLRAAIIAARAESMPKDNIDKAIKKAESSLDGDKLEEIRYEGFGPKGIAFIIECFSDNKNKTAADIRSFLKKSGGDLGTPGSVTYLFDRFGIIKFPKENISFDDIFEVAVNAGAEEVEDYDDEYEVKCAVEQFTEVRDLLIDKFGDPKFAGLLWVPKSPVKVSSTDLQSIEKLEDILDEYEAVQSLFSNYEPEEDEE